MSDPGFVVFLVDDDPAVLRGLKRLLNAEGYEALCFSSPQAFLAGHDASVPGCAVLDLMMPELDGLVLQQMLTGNGFGRPIIFLTGYGDIPTSVQAMKAGATDFLTKPVQRETLLTAIVRAQKQDAAVRQRHGEMQTINSRLERLTPREREVLEHVVAGRLNKQIAANLGTAEKTIKVHRGRVMRKLGVRSVADLVRMTERAGISPRS
jgi:FixJ family two-component response regulator